MFRIKKREDLAICPFFLLHKKKLSITFSVFFNNSRIRFIGSFQVVLFKVSCYGYVSFKVLQRYSHFSVNTNKNVCFTTQQPIAQT